MTKWIDWIIAALSSVLVLATSADAILHGLRLVPVLLGGFLVAVVVSFWYLKAASRHRESELEGRILDTTGKPAVRPAVLTGRRGILVARAALVLGCVGVAVTLLAHRARPSLRLQVDDVREFEVVSGLMKTVYSKAGLVEGEEVYGRGQRLRLSLVNLSSIPLDVLSVGLRLKSHDTEYSPQLRYDAMNITLPHTRLPIEALARPVCWDDADLPGSAKPVGSGRIKLDPRGKLADTHQIEFSVEALSPGLWCYVVTADYIEPKTGRTATVVSDGELRVLLRGK